MRVLWLASWYPNPYDRFNGDFIQRHARALSQFIPLDVIHVVQLGSEKQTSKGMVTHVNGNLNEFVSSFDYKPWGIKWLDKIRYNLAYQWHYDSLLEKYVSQYGAPDLLHVHVPIKAGIIAKKKAAIWEIDYVVLEHSSLYDSAAVDNFYKRSNYFRKHSREIFKGAKAVLTVSAAIGKKIQNLFELPAVQVLHNVVDTNAFRYIPTARPGVFRWLHVSTLYPLKNVQGIIEAFSKLNEQRKDWELVIVGPPSPSLQQQVAALQLEDKVLFTGEIAYEEVAGQMQEASAFVLFSKHENFPCVIIESLCCGLPVVSSNVGGVPEAVNDSNGILVEPGNTDALTKVLNTMMDNYNQYDREQIAKEAAARYSYEVIGMQLVQLYGRLMENR